jgi:hypothetical protein
MAEALFRFRCHPRDFMSTDRRDLLGYPRTRPAHACRGGPSALRDPTHTAAPAIEKHRVDLASAPENGLKLLLGNRG